VPIIRRNKCVFATLGTCYSVWMTVWYAGCFIQPCISDSHPSWLYLQDKYTYYKNLPHNCHKHPYITNPPTHTHTHTYPHITKPPPTHTHIPTHYITPLLPILMYVHNMLFLCVCLPLRLLVLLNRSSHISACISIVMSQCNLSLANLLSSSFAKSFQCVVYFMNNNLSWNN